MNTTSWIGFSIMASALVILTMPEGPEVVGAQTIVGLQGMVFITVTVIRGLVWLWKNRKEILDNA